MRAVLLVGLLLLPCGVSAEIYKWVDENGTVHFEDRKPNHTRYEQFKVKSVSGVQIYRVPPASAVRKAPSASKQVVMYGTTWCGYCAKARSYFQARNISFQDWDIESSPTAKSEYDALQGKGVPLIVVGDTVMSGFSEARFDQLYGR